MSTNEDLKKKAAWADAPMAGVRTVSASRLELNKKLASITLSEEEITSELLSTMLDYIVALRATDSSDIRQGILKAVISLLRKPATKLSKSDVQKVVGTGQQRFIPQQTVVRVGQKQINAKAKGSPTKGPPKTKLPDPVEVKIRSQFGPDYKSDPKYVEAIRIHRSSVKGLKKTKLVA